MFVYMASYEEAVVAEVDAVGDFYAGSLRECERWARTQLRGANEGDVVEIERIEISQLPKRKLILRVLNGTAYVRARVAIARYMVLQGEVVKVRSAGGEDGRSHASSFEPAEKKS
jgi:hypothetical protein